MRKKDKYCNPQYQEWDASKIPTYNGEGFMAKVLAGKVFDVTSPLITRTPTIYVVFEIDAGKTYDHLIPKDWNTILIVQ